MAIQNPYEVALRVDPNREKQELAKLKSDPAKLQELGLAPDENFSNLKNDPVKYNRVLSYVKSQTYKSPAYGALASGSSRPEFVESQTGSEYGKTPTQYRQEQAPKLQTQYGVEPAQQRYQTVSELAYSAPGTIAEEVKKKGGYNIESLKSTNDAAVTNFLNIRDKYIRGEVDRATYINAVSQMSTASRSLESGQTGLEEETKKAMGVFNENLQRAKDQYENAYKKFNDALDLQTKGYEEARSEKRKAAEEMFSAAKDMVDESRKEEKEYQSAKGKIYNPYIGQFETKPGSGPANLTKMFNEADSVRKDLEAGKLDWGQAYNRISAQYPQYSKPIPGDPSGKTYIDAALGGQAVFQGGTYSPEKSTGFAKAGAKQKGGEYFTAPGAGGKTRYLFGDKNNPTSAQEVTADQYLKATSKAEGVVSGGSDINTALSNLKNQGYTRKDIEKAAKKKYGSIPDVVKNWLDNNY